MLSSRSLQRAERRDEGTGILSIEPQWKSWERERRDFHMMKQILQNNGDSKPSGETPTTVIILGLMHLDVMTLKSRRLFLCSQLITCCCRTESSRAVGVVQHSGGADKHCVVTTALHVVHPSKPLSTLGFTQKHGWNIYLNLKADETWRRWLSSCFKAAGFIRSCCHVLSNELCLWCDELVCCRRCWLKLSSSPSVRQHRA